jgi:hypothetical protein
MRHICHTEAGKSFLTYARQALSAAVAARSRAQDAARNAQGQLKLGNMPVLPRQSLAYAGFELPAHGRVSTARYSGSCLWPTTTSRDSARTPFFTTSRAGLGISRGCPRILGILKSSLLSALCVLPKTGLFGSGIL